MSLRFWIVLAGCVGLSACGGSGRPEPPQRIAYLALGASDALGVGAEPFTRGYVYRIAEDLEQRVERVFLVNLGVPRADTEAIRKVAEVSLASQAEPHLVTVWTGANDLIAGQDADGFEEELEDLFDRLRDKAEDAVIVAANLPDLTQLPRFRRNPDRDVTRERIAAFNAAIAEQAEDYDVLLVDLSREPVDDMLVSEDGFHPNTGGHRRLAQMFLRIVLPALGLAPTS